MRVYKNEGRKEGRKDARAPSCLKLARGVNGMRLMWESLE